MFATSTMTVRSTILALHLIFSFAAAQKDNGDECSCFRTNGSAEDYFTNHQFHDYRNIRGISSIVPSLITNITDTPTAFATSDFFLNEAWTSVWRAQNWNNSDSMVANSASVLMINSPNNVYIETSTDKEPDYSTYLTLRTSRLNDFQSVAEIDSVEQNFQFLSARFHARVVGSPGACAGMFTYLANDAPMKVQEADIEILTKDPRNAVQYTNQPSDNNGNAVPQATVNATNPGGRDWTLWNTYRVDWTPKVTSWYVNGESVANISFQAPKDPAGLIINMWSDGGAWTGNMSLYDEAYLQIQWMQLVYNTSGQYAGSDNKKRDNFGVSGLLEKRKGTPGCQAVCSVDEQVNVTGTPALLYNNTGMAPTTWKAEAMGSLVLLPLLLLGGALFGCF